MAATDTNNLTGKRTGASNSGSSGRLFVLSAPSGAGKTTLCKRILARFGNLHYSISYTTRKPRSGEVEGEDYHFIPKSRFEQMIRENRWAEWARVHGNFYGTSADLLKQMMDSGYDVLLDIDVAGARQIRERFPDSIHIFVMPPSMPALKERLLKRSSDDPEEIERRMKAAEMEISHRDQYDHVIVNDDLESAEAALAGLIDAYRQPADNVRPNPA